MCVWVLLMRYEPANSFIFFLFSTALNCPLVFVAAVPQHTKVYLATCTTHNKVFFFHTIVVLSAHAATRMDPFTLCLCLLVHATNRYGKYSGNRRLAEWPILVAVD